jgi:hypothetical protein
MEKLFAPALLTLSALAISYLILKYWNKKLIKDFNTHEVSNSFAVFAVLQILAIFFSIYLTFDVQTLSIIESLQPFSKADYQTFWSSLGLFVIGITFIYVLSVFIGLVMYKSAVTTNKELRENINGGNVAVALIVGFTIFLVHTALSYFALRMILADWVLGTITYTPLN